MIRKEEPYIKKIAEPYKIERPVKQYTSKTSKLKEIPDGSFSGKEKRKSLDMKKSVKEDVMKNPYV